MKPNLLSLAGRKIFPLLFCFFILSKSQAQHLLLGYGKTKWEAGLNFGPSFFLGDLGGNAGKGTNFLKDLNLEFTKMMKGAFITMYPNQWLGFRINANYTFLEGDDAVINTEGIDELYRKQRNLDFKSNVWELQGSIEVYPTMFFHKEDDFEPRFRPYVFGGLGIFHFDPQGSLKDAAGNKTWYHLKPLRTEGQGMSEYPQSKEYQLTQLNVPYGGGIKYYFSDRFNFGIEFLYRKTFTDYIDDVSKQYIDASKFTKYMSAPNASLATQLSDKTIPIIFPGMTRWAPGTQRGDLKDNDTYFSIIGKIGIRLGPIYDSKFNRSAARQTRCPTVY